MVKVPPSKSHTMRALLFALLAKGRSRIENLLLSPDTDAMIAACCQFGATIERDGENIEVEGGVFKPCGTVDVGNSGIAYRFLTALAALGDQPVYVTGDHSIQMQRPILPLHQALQQLGVEINPIRGPINPGKVVVEGGDSQFVSALLIALSFASGPSEIIVRNPGEKPWIDLTLHWLNRFNIGVEAKDYTHYALEGRAEIAPFTYVVGGDYSSAAFPAVAALLTKSELILDNLDPEDCQGDKKLFVHLKKMGAQIEREGRKLVILPSSELLGCEIDVNEIIDAVPILAVIGCFAKGVTRLKNAKVARTKECDRLSVMTTELRKMGADIEEDEEGLTIRPSPLRGAHLHSHKDHRVAMALSVASLGAQGESVIDEMDCIAKTYPNFEVQLNRFR
ncbi:MAG: 3-phosphoshikimate 1-carboxyvinyltransferase [Chlamydiales bacterium]|nr:3-phosphoshikimate 1-carboxyvinyltransferase [Chlamydiales bacterium]MCH9620003.1 3-phosphoshikimate 1-carboxyvinyltransferase [Chlamydiales bacterium]MCH9622893.1 3-phosphoshikimate 1-carboxyvinyltransferase [Chlamydiales bacterium]